MVRRRGLLVLVTVLLVAVAGSGCSRGGDGDPGATGGASTVPASETTTTSVAAGAMSPLVAATKSGQLVLVDVETGRVLRVLTKHPPPDDQTGAGRFEGLSLTPDGRRLAFAASPVAHGGTFGPYESLNDIMVRDLGTGQDEAWLPEGDLDVAKFPRLAWAPDSRRLAISVSYENTSILVLDTGGPARQIQGKTVSTEPYVELLSPDWQATTGKLGAVAWCCYGSDPEESVPFHALLLDPETGKSEALLGAPITPNWIDFDASGRRLLWVDDQGRLLVRDGREERTIGDGYVFAIW